MDAKEIENLNRIGKQAAESITLSAQCLSCGISYTETFPWFKKHRFNCPECGGPIDDSPIYAFAEQAIERLKQLPNAERQPSGE
jgi:peptide subunit release factor 1 (eRF1)